KKIKGQTWLDDILMSATSAAVVDEAEQDISALLRERHHIHGDDDFNLRHPTEIAEAVKQSTQTMEALLAAIASVSLLVGGIGIGQPGTPSLRVGQLPQDIRLDGILDESAWVSAPAIELTMSEPTAGARPTARTRVRVLADSRAIVIGISCDDPEPARIVSF